GLLSAVTLVILSPAVWVKVLGNAQAIFPYDHPAIISMTTAFLVTWLGSVTDKSARASSEADAFEEQYIRAQTGLGAAGAHAH
ncbi:MAG: cation acetate symporter, partial [Betaproteobacteria bacterium HGW-Betaproteobacteria-18]